MSTPSLTDLPERLSALLEPSDPQASLAACLEAIANEFEAVTATLHRIDPSCEFLLLVASRGLPEQVLPMTQRIPVGKGMAGLCAERREPVTVCNIQSDDSGTARVGARRTGVAGGIVVPILDDGGNVVGTLGIGKAEEHDYNGLETSVLERCASRMQATLSRS